jgi:hypothetical protein
MLLMIRASSRSEPVPTIAGKRAVMSSVRIHPGFLPDVPEDGGRSSAQRPINSRERQTSAELQPAPDRLEPR